MPNPGLVELLLRELAISKSDHQDDDVTPLIMGSDVVLSLWRGVSLTVSLPKLGGRVTSLTMFGHLLLKSRRLLRLFLSVGW